MRTTDSSRALAWGLTLLLCASIDVAAAAHDNSVAVGLGSYRSHREDGILGPSPPPPLPQFRTSEAAKQAAPTNQWYSSAIFWRWTKPLYAQPMTYRTSEAGFEVGLPDRTFAIEDGGRKREIRYLHSAAITISPIAFKPSGSRLAKHSDWLIELEMAAGAGESLKATVLHGSPFSYYDCSTGDVRFHLAGTPKLLWNPLASGHDRRVAAFTLNGHVYAIFAPTGSSWQWATPTDPVLHLPATARYFSVAGLPDDRDTTVEQFLSVAYAFPTETRSQWSYDERSSRVRVTYSIATVAREGRGRETLIGLYPHQWTASAVATDAAPHYDTVRGQLRLIRGNQFTTERTFHGILPSWGPLEDPAAKMAVDSLLADDVAKSAQIFFRDGHGTYWVGKGLGALAQLASIAEAEGKQKERATLLGQLKSSQESWLDGRHATHFQHDSTLGSLFGYPQEYNSVTNINDHHFHYGYWYMAAAHVALRDRTWITPDHWGGMVAQLVADVATEERGRADYPFLRNFDTYEGHSWASGTAEFDAGNNQESSSEAINAWAGLVLLGEATGDRKLRDLGIYLYTTEVASALQYWFDVKRQVLAPELGSQFASMVFGGKYAYNTWWTEEPRQILGINLLPFTPASTYLAQDPDYIRRSLAALPAEVNAYQSRGITDGTPPDVWQDVLVSYQALADPDAALRQWDKRSSAEFGETRTHTLYWISSLKEMGQPDFSVTADTPLYAVFRKAGGPRTYLAYNARDTRLKVTFSDGKVLEVTPHSLARGH
ncbi:MAG: glycosyl hydrolase [Pseudomonadota bacterium]